MSDKLTQEAPALIGIGAQSIVDRAKELGLVWNLRPATVFATANVANLPGVQIQYDGDPSILRVVNLTGQSLQVGDRVMGMEVPPSANYVIGRLGNPAVGLGWWASASSIGFVGPFSAETVIVNITACVFPPLRAFKAEWRMDLATTTGTNAGIWRIRQDGLAGTQMGIGVWALRNIQSNDCGSDMIIANRQEIPQTADLTLTCASSAGTITATGTTTEVIWLRVFDVGPSYLVPNAFGIT
jgi:hypothetical protein